jgi:hypothetical protein
MSTSPNFFNRAGLVPWRVLDRVFTVYSDMPMKRVESQQYSEQDDLCPNWHNHENEI